MPLLHPGLGGPVLPAVGREFDDGEERGGGEGQGGQQSQPDQTVEHVEQLEEGGVADAATDHDADASLGEKGVVVVVDDDDGNVVVAAAAAALLPLLCRCSAAALLLRLPYSIVFFRSAPVRSLAIQSQ